MGVIGTNKILYGLLIFSGIVLMIVLIAMIVLLRLHKKRMKLLGDGLSSIIDGANTTIKAERDYSNSICLMVNDVDMRKQFMEMFDYYEQNQDDVLIEQHLAYLRTNKAYSSNNDSDNVKRAIMGAAFQSMIQKVSTKTLDLSLIHHVISYLYSEGYQDLLVKFVNRVIQHELSTIYKFIRIPVYSYHVDRESIKLTIKYDTKMRQNQVSLEVLVQNNDSISELGSEHCIRYLYSDINLSVLPVGRNNQALQYKSCTGMNSVVKDSAFLYNMIHGTRIPTFCVGKEETPSRRVSSMLRSSVVDDRHIAETAL
ncbi:hypothetical protein EDL79_01295 [Ehrlichia ruminantium]|uniref:Uncharacterized protein n=1 Tax=Ehrlichia ruminantium TaxID=779 RepID=A0AAE6UIB6_EHRRU|nr:hypothetical protein [Ehrlichia ruminantium]QGR02315.1 hypothetical protein EDL81_01295 [Ehrlichia ruminantium]QGR03235.1 hypothetical protein EDL80_01295 [Ehrlichia ruminantium]QGR04160.1 hypothetical protein EDL79_01295 [Ehrlichia ruminantium]